MAISPLGRPSLLIHNPTSRETINVAKSYIIKISHGHEDRQTHRAGRAEYAATDGQARLGEGAGGPGRASAKRATDDSGRGGTGMIGKRLFLRGTAAKRRPPPRHAYRETFTRRPASRRPPWRPRIQRESGENNTSSQILISSLRLQRNKVVCAVLQPQPVRLPACLCGRRPPAALLCGRRPLGRPRPLCCTFVVLVQLIGLRPVGPARERNQLSPLCLGERAACRRPRPAWQRGCTQPLSRGDTPRFLNWS